MTRGAVCERCKNQRWLIKRQRWTDDTCVAEVRPFDSGSWQQYGQLAISAALVSKALVACGDCNAKQLAPWAKVFRGEGAAAAEGGFG
jgi:hypothetical protein